jgi:GNAT superfamily N-acetyltransferase
MNKQALLIRELDLNNLSVEGEIFSFIHNGSLYDIWGFAPLSPEEGAAIWRKLQGYYDKSLILIAEVNGKPAGLCLTLSAIRRNVVTAVPKTARLAVLAVLPAYRFKGIEATLIAECFRRAQRKGIINLEFSQIAENNRMMNKIIQSTGWSRKSRVYQVYRKTLHN